MCKGGGRGGWRHHYHENGRNDIVEGQGQKEARNHHCCNEVQRIRPRTRQNLCGQQAVDLQLLQRTAEGEAAEHEQDVGLAKVGQVAVSKLLGGA